MDEIVSREGLAESTEGGIMMTHTGMNGHVSSEIVEMESSEGQDPTELAVNGNGDGTGRPLVADESIQDVQWDLEDIKVFAFERCLMASLCSGRVTITNPPATSVICKPRPT